MTNAGTAIVIITILFMIQPFKQTERYFCRLLRIEDSIPNNRSMSMHKLCLNCRFVRTGIIYAQ